MLRNRMLELGIAAAAALGYGCGSREEPSKPSPVDVSRPMQAIRLPLRCVAEIWDNGQSLRFQVFDANDNSVLRIRALRLDELRDEKQLEQALQLARSRIRAQGLYLQKKRQLRLNLPSRNCRLSSGVLRCKPL